MLVSVVTSAILTDEHHWGLHFGGLEALFALVRLQGCDNCKGPPIVALSVGRVKTFLEIPTPMRGHWQYVLVPKKLEVQWVPDVVETPRSISA